MKCSRQEKHNSWQMLPSTPPQDVFLPKHFAVTGGYDDSTWSDRRVNPFGIRPPDRRAAASGWPWLMGGFVDKPQHDAAMTSATKVRITEQRHDTDNGPEGAKGSTGSEAGTHHRALRTCSHILISTWRQRPALCS